MATLDTTVSDTRLIAGSKVSGTTVYDTVGEKLGSIEDVMIDKTSGRIAYALMSFGGFLGIGDKHHPLPWTTLKYDTSLGGYVVNIDRRTLEGAPVYDDDEAVNWEDRDWGQRVHDYYHADPYWNVMP
jgi:sporulation protein YlmC with PRC-barrel domain